MVASMLRPSSRFRSSICSSCLRRSTAFGLRFSSSETAPPLLSKIKADIKIAMRAKDTARLNVLRSIISETNQLASGPNPIRTDLQILAMLRKRKAASQVAAQEFADANRQDLKEKEEAQLAVLEEYASSVQLMSEDELKTVVADVVASLGEDGKNSGRVMKALLQQGGSLDGKPVDKKQLSDVVRATLSSK